MKKLYKSLLAIALIPAALSLQAQTADPDPGFGVETPGEGGEEGEEDPSAVWTYSEYTIDPMENQAYESLNTFIVNFMPSPESVELNPNCTEAVRLVKYVSGSPVKVADMEGMVVEKSTSIRLYLTKTFDTKGEYGIILPEGYFLMDGKPNPECSFGLYTVLGRENPEYQIIVTPEPGEVYEIDEVVISFDPVPDKLTVSGLYADMVSLMKYTASWGIAGNLNAEVDYATKSVKIKSFSPITAQGKYRIDIPATLYSYNGEPCKAAQYEYDIVARPSAVNEIDAQASVTVYSVDSSIVLRAATSSDLEALRPGLYIVNGRKVLITK